MGWPLCLVAWFSKVSTRDLGTGLPLTKVMFWAMAAVGTVIATDRANSDALAKTDSFFMGVLPF